MNIGIKQNTASDRHKILRENELYWYPPETIPYKEYMKRKMGSVGTESLVGGSPIILLSVDDAIIFVSYGQSNMKKLHTIKKLVNRFEPTLTKKPQKRHKNTPAGRDKKNFYKILNSIVDKI